MSTQVLRTVSHKATAAFMGVAIAVALAHAVDVQASTVRLQSTVAPVQEAPVQEEASQEAGEAQRELVADRTLHVFGDVPIAGGNVQTRFTVENKSSEALQLVELYTSCMCTTVTLEFADGPAEGPFGMPGHDFLTTLDRELAPGEKVGLTVTFDPGAHGPDAVGPVTRQVLVGTSGGSQLILTLTANVVRAG